MGSSDNTPCPSVEELQGAVDGLSVAADSLVDRLHDANERLNAMRSFVEKATAALKDGARRLQDYATSRAVTGGGYYSDGEFAHRLAVDLRAALADIRGVAPAKKRCGPCDGAGHFPARPPDNAPPSCHYCNGTGEVAP